MTTETSKTENDTSGNIKLKQLSDMLSDIHSFLSPSVCKMVCKLGICNSVSEILTHEGILDWHIIESIFNSVGVSKETGGSSHYENYLISIAPCIAQVLKVYQAISLPDFQSCYRDYFMWTNNEKAFFHAFELLQHGTCITSSTLACLLLTASVERALGNVFLLKGKDVPYLLKDLLATTELEDIFGNYGMKIVNVFLGSPASLNLRNILWHGFVSPTELDKRYGFFLLALTATLSTKLTECGIKQKDIPFRAYLNLDQTYELKEIFPDVRDQEVSELGFIFQHSALIPLHMKHYWNAALVKYQKARYGECLVLLIPQLECCLRVLFAVLNNCPQCVLTAEPTARYITLTEIFAEYLDDGCRNIFTTVLNDGEMELFLDLFIHPEGPRVRDRLSHGEMNYFEIPKYLASHILCLCTVICMKFTSDSSSHLQSKFMDELNIAAAKYQPLYHPTSILKRKVLSLISSLQNWETCPLPNPEELNAEELNTSQQFFHEPSYTCMLFIGQVYEVESLISRWYSVKDGLLLFENFIKNHRIPTVYRPRIEVEIVTLLRKIVYHIIEVSENIQQALCTSYTLWKERKLRSRQRTTYFRLLKSISVLYSGLRTMLVLVIAHIFQINKTSVWDTEETSVCVVIKFLKLQLKQVENLNIMTGIKMNKWQEASQNTSDFLIRISNHCKYFSELNMFGYT